MNRRVALIPGVSGVVGRRVAEHVASLPDWEVIGLARRPPATTTGYRTIAVDLTDAASCRAALGRLAEVTHVFYCARYDHSTTVKEPIPENVAMLRNVLDAVEPVARGLEHVHLVHGSKYYGSDLGPYRTPAKETDPRLHLENWYYGQEDVVIERSRNARWTYSTSRPHGICDRAPGIARSMSMVMAVYATISRELGLPLFFPGTPENFNALYQCTDAGLLARAIVWVSTQPQCANQCYNVTNGDFIRWVNVWPRFAQYFGMEYGGVRTVRLAQAMADKGPVWERIVAKHGLAPTPYEQVALWPYGDFIFNAGRDIMSDTLKLRRHGFWETLDTEEMFLGLFEGFRAARIIP